MFAPLHKRENDTVDIATQSNYIYKFKAKNEILIKIFILVYL